MDKRIISFLQEHHILLASLYIENVIDKKVGALVIDTIATNLAEQPQTDKKQALSKEALVSFVEFDKFTDDMKKEYLLQMRDLPVPPHLKNVIYTLKPIRDSENKDDNLVLTKDNRICFIILTKDSYHMLVGYQKIIDTHHKRLSRYLEFKTISASIAEYNAKIAEIIPKTDTVTETDDKKIISELDSEETKKELDNKVKAVVEELSEKTSNWTLANVAHGQRFNALCAELITTSATSTETDRTMFAFRQDTDFTDIIMSGTKTIGAKLLQYIAAYYASVDTESSMLDDLHKVMSNDVVGTPLLYEYRLKSAKNSIDRPIAISGASLRHWHTAIELRRYFGKDMPTTILEIGSGYGGLANVMVKLNPAITSYTLVEQSIVLELSKKYLNMDMDTDTDTDLALTTVSTSRPQFKFATMADIAKANELEAEEYQKTTIDHSSTAVDMGLHFMNTNLYDCVISEYALSEMDSDGMNFYFEHIIGRTKYLYLAMNIWSQENKQIFRQKIDTMFNTVIEVPEYPEGDWPNYRLFCSDRKTYKKEDIKVC